MRDVTILAQFSSFFSSPSLSRTAPYSVKTKYPRRSGILANETIFLLPKKSSIKSIQQYHYVYLNEIWRVRWQLIFLLLSSSFSSNPILSNETNGNWNSINVHSKSKGAVNFEVKEKHVFKVKLTYFLFWYFFLNWW